MSSNESRVTYDVADFARSLQGPGTLVGVGEGDFALFVTEDVQRIAVAVDYLAAEVLLLDQGANGELNSLGWAVRADRGEINKWSVGREDSLGTNIRRLVFQDDARVELIRVGVDFTKAGSQTTSPT